MENILNELYEVINERKENPEEGCIQPIYLIRDLDKILKKLEKKVLKL